MMHILHRPLNAVTPDVAHELPAVALAEALLSSAVCQNTWTRSPEPAGIVGVQLEMVERGGQAKRHGGSGQRRERCDIAHFAKTTSKASGIRA